MNKSGVAVKSDPESTITQVIADGVNTVLSNPALLAIPVLVDAFYLLGRRVTLEPMMSRWSQWVASENWSISARASELLADIGRVDVFGLVWILIPSLLGGSDRGELYVPISRSTWQISNLAVGIPVVVLVVILTAFAYSLFGLWLADTGLERGRSWRERLRRTPIVALRVLALVGLILGIAAFLLLPVGMAWAATTVVGINLNGLLLPIVTLVVVAMIALFYFSPEALFVAESSAPDALRLSARVVKRYTWHSLAFIGATMILGWGLSVIWERIAVNPPGMALAIGASAFVGCSLALAAIFFFRDRLNRIDHEFSMNT